MNNKRLKSNNGITLIALIITIIVLLILAMVSIKLIWDGGIIAHAKNAVNKYEEAQRNETDQINNIFGNNGGGDEYKSDAPDELQKYVLGEELKGQDLSNICNWQDDWSFPKELKGEKINFLNLGQYCYTENNEEMFDYAIYITYKNKVYKIIGKYEYIEGENGSDGTEKITTKGVNMVYEPKGREGQKIEYSIDGTEANKKEWTILYDNGDNIEIVSPESMGSLTLGYEDAEATGNNDFEKAVNSYNNAIDRINTYTRSLVTNTNKIAVRSAGSNPESPNSRNTSKYTSAKLEEWSKETKYNGTAVNINGIGERSDNNYEQDLVRMSYYGIAGTGKEYWLASRFVESYSDGVYFNVDTVFSGGTDSSFYLWSANSYGDTNTGSNSYAVRPVVKINS